jgi:hypothetical protein
VDRKLNLWYDHGMGKGGTLIDFGLLYFNCSLGELLTRLSSGLYSSSFYPPLASPPLKREGDKIQVVSATDITSPSLTQYLADRRIDESLAARYCKEIRFTLYGKDHLAIGCPNNSGGYELRNAYFKGSASPKDITTLGPGKGTMGVFEGFFSFLSYLQLNGEKKPPEGSFLVLNSLSLWQRAGPAMEAYRKVHLYLDQDAAGRMATQKALSASLRCIDKSAPYRHYKDLNELLVAGKRSRFGVPRQGRSL